MSPLKVRRVISGLVSLSPKRGVGRNLTEITVGQDDTLRFENDINLGVPETYNYAGCVKVFGSDQNVENDAPKTFLNLDVGDVVLIKRDKSAFGCRVEGVAWPERR
jgi:hypothetical protein